MLTSARTHLTGIRRLCKILEFVIAVVQQQTCIMSWNSCQHVLEQYSILEWRRKSTCYKEWTTRKRVSQLSTKK